MRKQSTNVPQNEREWEEFVGRNRDPLTKAAGTLLSFLVLLGAAAGLLAAGKPTPWYWPWIGLNLAAIIGLRFYRRHLTRLEEALD